MFDSFIERNDPNGEVRKEIQKFKFDYLLQDDTVVEYEDLLKKLKTMRLKTLNLKFL